jgi:hypothetical protein
MTSIAGCCARAASGHAVAPPRSDTNSRRLNGSNGIRHPRSQDQGAGYQIGGGQPANIDSGFSRPQHKRCWRNGDVQAGSLDDPSLHKPTAQIWVRSAPP